SLGKQYPEPTIEATIGDTYRLAKQALRMVVIDDRSKEYDHVREGMALKLKVLTLELAGEDPSPARRLCAQAAAFAYMEYWVIQSLATSNKWSSPAQLRRLAAAHKRHLSSLRCLSQIVRAEQPRPRPIVATQVNVSAPPAAEWPDSLPAFPGK